MTRRALLTAAVPAVAMAGVAARPDVSGMARRVFGQINEVRAVWGVAALEWQESVAECARQQCARKEQLRFSGHLDPERGGVAERLTQAGVRWARCGENLFELKGYDDPVNFALVFWWYSAGHHDNLLNPAFVKTGVGVTVDSDGRFFVTQIFVEPPVVVSGQRRLGSGGH